jgi:1-acyl-sn-glycerol-3-phosphate acyltransferase
LSEQIKAQAPRVEPIDKHPPEGFGQILVLNLFKGALKLLFRLRYHGMENVPEKGPFILVANHQSMVDVPAVLCEFRPWVYMLAKIELFKHALPSRFFYWYGAFPVNRQKMDLSSAKRTLTVLRRGGVVGIFPEGTRVKAQENPRAHQPSSGVIYFARKAQCSILPVSINRPYKLFRRNHIYVGPPLSLSDLSKELGEGAGDELLVKQLRKKVYELQNHEY